MCANPQDNWLNTIAVRASYILPFYEAISSVKTKKTGGWSIYPRKNLKQNQFVFFSFAVDPLD